MMLPNYFLADLPQDARLTPQIIEDACEALRRNRLQYLSNRSTGEIIHFLGALGRSWLHKDFPFRRAALEEGPSKTGYSPATIARGLDSFFANLTCDNLLRLIEQDLGNPERLDRICASRVEETESRRGIVTGPALLVHITAGNVPNPAFASMVLGLLLRSAQFVKCATGGSFLPRLFAHSIYNADRKIGACLELAEWHGGDHPLERVLFDRADCLTATGTDETLSRIRLRLPPGQRFVGYGHRASFAFVAAEMLIESESDKVAAGAAADIAAWNQLGCLSPHVIYLENGGAISGERFAESLARELDRLEQVEPRGPLPAEGAAVIASRRSIYEVRAAHSPDTRIWMSPNSTAWTVVYESEARFQGSCLNRFVYVKNVSGMEAALEGADSVRGKVSTVGLAASPARITDLATRLARWGAMRVCPIGQMQNPPFTWRHDGRPALGDLVLWTDCEV